MLNTIFFDTTMSIFKTTWIVLQIKKSHNTESLYTIFFKEYGILNVIKRKKSRERPLDIGYTINCEIITRESRNIHTIWAIKVISHLHIQDGNYDDIYNVLSIIAYVHRELPVGNTHYEIYDILSTYLTYWSKNMQAHLVTTLKIAALCGNLVDTHSDTTTQKILRFIHRSPYTDILRLETLPTQIYRNLESITI